MRVGDVIAGRYRVMRQAGSGAMGQVYEGHDLIRGGAVALKTLRGDVDADEKSRARLRFEARALRGIDHPAVVRYVDHGSAADDEPFLVMEWVEGATLAQRLRVGVTPRDALALVERIALGLDAAHAAGVVHRDLKPSNVMLRRGELAQAVLVDFGVARVRRTTGGVRWTGDRLGTPRYMAPEQIRGARDVDGKADVFALACILYECLTGRRAFVGRDPVTVLTRILFESPPEPSMVHAHLAPLDPLVRAMMEHDPVRRLGAAAAAEQARGLGASLFGGPHDAAADESPRTLPGSDGPRQANASAATSPPSAGTLPLHSAPLISRAADPETACDRLVALLASGSPRISVTCRDPARAPAIVTEALRRLELRGRAWDAVVVVSLTRARTAADAARSVAAQAGVPLDVSLAAEVAVGAALSRMGRWILVLHGVDAAAEALGPLLGAWVDAAPRLRVVTTGRAAVDGAAALAVESAI
jgi:serine/threonine protein kinase